MTLLQPLEALNLKVLRHLVILVLVIASCNFSQSVQLFTILQHIEFFPCLQYILPKLWSLNLYSTTLYHDEIKFKSYQNYFFAAIEIFCKT